MFPIFITMFIVAFVIKKMLLQIWVQKSASGMIDKSCFHFIDGMDSILSDSDILYWKGV